MKRRKYATHSPEPWDAEGIITLYATPDAADAMTMIEIRANVTKSGWDTVAFIEAIWPGAKVNARLIAASPKLLDALLTIKRMAGKSGDHGTCPFTLLDLIADEALAAIQLATLE
jgi:hypothetical protein